MRFGMRPNLAHVACTLSCCGCPALHGACCMLHVQAALGPGGYLSAFPMEHWARLEALKYVWAPYYVVRPASAVRCSAVHGMPAAHAPCLFVAAVVCVL